MLDQNYIVLEKKLSIYTDLDRSEVKINLANKLRIFTINKSIY